MNLNPISGIVEAVGGVIDDLHTSDEERAQIDLDSRRIDAEVAKGQLAVNQAEASSGNWFVAGWRPAIGWIGAVSLAYQFVLYPLLIWGWTTMQAHGWIDRALQPPPMLDADALWVLLSGMLGIAGMRTFEKSRGVAK